VALTEGSVRRVNGPVLEVEGLTSAMLDLVQVGAEKLPGEVIRLDGAVATVQVYAYTGGLKPGDAVVSTGFPLQAELGPGLLGGVFDGMLRPLDRASEFVDDHRVGDTLDRRRRLAFHSTRAEGDHASPGELLGEAMEDERNALPVLVPPGSSGTVEWIAPAGEYTVADPIARVGGTDIRLAHRWSVRQPRPVLERLRADAPLVTGQRALDLFFPIARGSSAAVPGGFGTGKTVLLQQIAKWCDADVIVYVACGERGNEAADVLEGFSKLEDPRTGRSLRDRTVLIANTSNMPVLAREASIYTAATVAEYYRDMGRDVVLIADSTSRWAEALREVASRTGEPPAEEGYPAGLASALAAFYERAGRVRALGGAEGSLTILGAVSPPGGDMTEPVSAHTRRFVRCVWSLDPDLAYARHYPAIGWEDSSSRDAGPIARRHLVEGDPAWGKRRERALGLLAEAEHLEAVASLVGASSLPGPERVVLLAARLLREAVLQQSSQSANDAYCAPAKQRALLELVLEAYDRARALVEAGVDVGRIEEVDFSPATHARDLTAPDDAEAVAQISRLVLGRLEGLA
jgi:V/A-type H+-transporting ATPase subunit A